LDYAGRSFQRYLLRNVVLVFKDITGKLITCDFPSLTILVPTKKLHPAELKGIDSVLGMDFIKREGFHFSYDPKEKKTFLEK
jgi:hypothetical protein